MIYRKTKKIWLALVVICIGIICYIIIPTQSKQETQHVMTLKDYLVSTFKSELPEINKNLPHKVDESTTLLSIEYTDGRVISRYKLSSPTESNSSINFGGDKLKGILIKQVCDQEFKRKLLEVDTEFVEIYQNPDGKTAFEVAVNKTDCIDLDNYNNN